MEDRDRIRPLHRAEGHRGQAEPPVVVDEVEDLDRTAVGERPVRGVGLSELVGQGGLEADERGARPLARLGGDQAAPAQQPHDRAHRGQRCAAACQVPMDGEGTGVEPLLEELRAQPHDRLRRREPHRGRRAVGPPRARNQPRLTLPAVPREELVQCGAPRASARARPRCGPRADVPRPDTARRPSGDPLSWCLRCLDTSTAGVSPISWNSHTIRATWSIFTRCGWIQSRDTGHSDWAARSARGANARKRFRLLRRGALARAVKNSINATRREGFEPSLDGLTIRCLCQLGYRPKEIRPTT